MTSILTRAIRKATRPVRQRLYPSPEDFTSPEGREVLARLAPRPLVVIAHPDDETFCAGLICHLVEKYNSRITIACATRGEGGTHGADKPDPVELARIRSKELVQATKLLGVQSAGFFGFEDPQREEPAFETPCEDVEAAIAVAITREKPTVIITHGSSGEYWHPAHNALHDAAVARANTVPVLTFNAWLADHPMPHLLNKDDPANFFLDATPYLTRRLRSLEQHQSQAGVFEKFAGGSLSRFVTNTRIEGYRLHGQSLETKP